MVNQYFFGLDLGQQQDHSALSIIERIDKKLPDLKYLKGYRPPAQNPATTIYHLGHLERFALGTSYTAVVDRTSALLNRKQFKGRSVLVIDATGVGAGIFDMFTGAGLKPIGVYFTGGNTVGRSGKFLTVPKRDLVFSLLALFETERLKVVAELEHAGTLRDELLNFRIKLNSVTGHDSYEHWRTTDHDDLLFATAIACWFAARRQPGSRAIGTKPKGF